MNPESETFFGSSHLPFSHLLFYPFWLPPFDRLLASQNPPK
jgi:hypothetical protein